VPTFRIVFMGPPSLRFRAWMLSSQPAILIPVVVTAPDKPQGRGLAMRPSQVKRRALSAGLPVLQPPLLKDPSFADAIRALDPDLIVVVAFRILPPSVFTIPRLGSMNLHASLLPRYRGAAPINRAIMMGETETGVTTFLLDEKIDTGGILLQERIPVFLTMMRAPSMIVSNISARRSSFAPCD